MCSFSPAARLAALLPFLLLLPSVAGAQNVVVVIADDVGVDAVAAYAEQPLVAPTPNLDALASQGVLFRNAWGYPTCSPFRASVLTGQHPAEHGVGGVINRNNPEQAYVLDPAPPNLPNLLAAAGYRTAAFGKWHVAAELGFSNADYFDGVVSLTEEHPNLMGFAHYAGNLFGRVPDYFDWPKTVDGVTTVTTTYATSDTADEAIAELGGTEPVFVWVAFNAPHAPWHQPPSPLLADPGIYDFGNPDDQYRAMLEAMDTELGRILASVDLTDTTVIFIGDNGTPAQRIEPPLLSSQAKGTVYEGGVNVPLIVAGQAVSAASQGQESGALVQATDLFATVLELTGVAAPPRDDAISLTPYLIDASAPSIRPAVFTETFLPNGGPIDPSRHERAAREARYKLVRNGTDPDELYDLDTDPLEQTPLDLGSLSPEEQQAYTELDAVLTGADQDDDGVLDPFDNCLVDANEAQADWDQDGYGDLCDADFDNSGTVESPDYVTLVLQFGGPPDPATPADVTGDGIVAAPDFTRLSQDFGGPPGPSGRACAGSIPCP